MNKVNHSKEYELEWQYSDDPDPVPPVGSDPYIHFVFMLRFPTVAPGKGHVAHFCFNVLPEAQSSQTGIVVVRRGFLSCIPFSKPDIMEFVETAVAKAFEGSSREDALNRLNTQFINDDIDYSDEFAADLLEADDLLTLIEEAFDGVERGDGITFHQACVIDDYGSDEDFLAARKLDTEARWQDVPFSAISKNPQFLNFLDPVGFRYYLPFAMSFAVTNCDKYDFETFFIYLAVLPTVAPREVGRGIGAAFNLNGFIEAHSFTPPQVNAIYRFICFMALRAEHEMDEDQFAAVKKWRQATLTKTNS